MRKLAFHLNEYLKAISQAFFLHNAAFGASLLALIALTDLWMFGCALVASTAGYLYSLETATPGYLRDCGLIPINGFFYGLAMASLFPESELFYICFVLGVLVLPFITKAAFEVLQHWKLSPFITPYIFAVWVAWLCGQDPALGQTVVISSVLSGSSWFSELGIDPILVSVGRLLFIPDATFGLLICALVCAFSPRRGLYFCLGTVIASEVAYLAVPNNHLFETGALSYSAGLVALALASFPEKFNWRTILMFSVFSAFVTLAMERLLVATSLPVLSLPYVLTLWLALLSRVPKFNISWERVEAIPLLQNASPAAWTRPRRQPIADDQKKAA